MTQVNCIEDVVRYNQNDNKHGCYCPKCFTYIPYRMKTNVACLKYCVPCYKCKGDYIVLKPPDFEAYLLDEKPYWHYPSKNVKNPLELGLDVAYVKYKEYIKEKFCIDI